MIKDIFVPEKIGSYYLMPKQVLGFDLAKTFVYASQVHFVGEKITLEKFYHMPLENDVNRPYIDRVSEVIKKIVEQAPSSIIKTSLSSAVVIFKELTLPFVDREKIAMIINYEVEPHLPFSLEQAVVDFIITGTNEDKHTSDVLVAAVQKEYIAEHLSYFQAAGIEPDTISVDLFDLYGLYKKIPAYSKENDVVVLMDIELYVTRIAFVVQGQLKYIRTIQKGIIHIAKKIAEQKNIPASQALEELIRFGFDKSNDAGYEAMLKPIVEAYLKEIEFTLQSFLRQSETQSAINQIIILGKGSELSGIDSVIADRLKTTCTFFDGNELLKIPDVSLQHATRIPQTNIMSLSTAFPNDITDHFNLRKENFALPTGPLFTKQLITTVSLILLIFISLFAYSWWQQRALNNRINAMQNVVVSSLNELNLTDEKNFLKAIEEAQETVEKENDLWFGFSRQQRFSFLKTLQNLSEAIDRKSVGLKLKKLVITSNEIALEGEVKGFEELKILERELRESKLFVSVPILQELKFSEKLTLKKNGGQSQ